MNLIVYFAEVVTVELENIKPLMIILNQKHFLLINNLLRHIESFSHRYTKVYTHLLVM